MAAISARVNPRLSVKLRSATMTQRIADDFPSIAASLKKLERDKEAAVNRPAQANERLIREADEARERAKKLPPGPERDALLKKACQAEITQGWLSSSELKPPD